MAKKAKAKKVAKKRGVKPGTKRGRYNKANRLIARLSNKTWRLLEEGKPLKVSENEMPFTPKILTLCGQLEDAVMNLETRISNSIAKINSLM